MIYFIDENPYEENLLKGQSFLSYIYHYHFNICIQPEPNIVDELEEEILEHIKDNIVSLFIIIIIFNLTFCLQLNYDLLLKNCRFLKNWI